MAPGRLFRPPNIAAAKPFRKGSSIKKGSRSKAGAKNNPAITPKIAARPQLRARMLRVGMPMVWAAGRFSDVARMANPSRVFCTRR